MPSAVRKFPICKQHVNDNPGMTQPDQSTDQDLIARTLTRRRAVMDGNEQARSVAHAHEVEARRRFAGATTINGTLEAIEPKRKPLWRRLLP